MYFPFILVNHIMSYTLICNSMDAVGKNQALEMERNGERFQFLKWGAKVYMFWMFESV